MITRRDALKATGLAIGAALILPKLSAAALADSVPVDGLMQAGPLGDVWLGPKDAKVTIVEYASMTCSHCAALILPKLSAAALADSVPVDGLMQAGPLGDVWLGPKDAKVTIVEYASMTCSHCAAFHRATYPTLKERYIDTGKVRFTLREFPLDPLATAAFMLARCDGDAKYYPITDLLFDQQPAWAFTQKPVDALEQMLKQAGFSKEKFEACLKDQKLYAAVNGVKQRGLETFKVDSTPTFFINGERYTGEMTVDGIEKIIKPILGA